MIAPCLLRVMFNRLLLSRWVIWKLPSLKVPAWSWVAGIVFEGKAMMLGMNRMMILRTKLGRYVYKRCRMEKIRSKVLTLCRADKQSPVSSKRKHRWGCPSFHAASQCDWQGKSVPAPWKTIQTLQAQPSSSVPVTQLGSLNTSTRWRFPVVNTAGYSYSLIVAEIRL